MAPVASRQRLLGKIYALQVELRTAPEAVCRAMLDSGVLDSMIVLARGANQLNEKVGNVAKLVSELRRVLEV